MDNSKPFTDDRGTITDLFVAPGYSVTHITFKKGAVRGNHYHKETYQHDLVVKGKLVEVYKNNSSGEHTRLMKSGDEMNFSPGEPHVYLAVEDSEIISTCKGKRVGSDYEKDTIRLNTPLL